MAFRYSLNEDGELIKDPEGGDLVTYAFWREQADELIDTRAQITQLQRDLSEAIERRDELQRAILSIASAVVAVTPPREQTPLEQIVDQFVAEARSHLDDTKKDLSL